MNPSTTEPAQEEGNSIPKQLFFIQYRGKVSEDLARSLHKINAPCTVVMILRKLKTVLPSLKPAVEKLLRSDVVYCITCPRCGTRYVGYTTRHLKTRYKEHQKKDAPVKKHLGRCRARIELEDDVEILDSSARGRLTSKYEKLCGSKNCAPSSMRRTSTKVK